MQGVSAADWPVRHCWSLQATVEDPHAVHHPPSISSSSVGLRGTAAAVEVVRRWHWGGQQAQHRIPRRRPDGPSDSTAH